MSVGFVVKPEMRGFSANSSILLKLAPSANTLTPSLFASATRQPLTHHNIFDPPYRFGKARGDGIGALRG